MDLTYNKPGSFFEQVWTGRQLTTVILNRHVEFVEAYNEK